ncbi:Early nodulin-like protein 3 [Acorus calamus]|uniref:Early nodulin-like protein 3 n=1 Tax=Acorus calamus TaxID=4465 RepID=A0AAV9FAW3_ACOCL|nr:Early nodulin-like protein 3 [Acorus calamus]
MASTVSAAPLFLSLIFITTLSSEAKDFLVGGTTNAWKIPSSPSDSLNRWAESTRFQIGDSLGKCVYKTVWKYEAGKDSVLQVTREAYLSCNTTGPVAEHRDGNTTVGLDKSGAFYFISGEKGHCEKGQKLIVVVLSKKSSSVSSPASAPMGSEGPAIAPARGGAVALGARRGGGIVGGLVVLGGLVGLLF